MSDSLRVALIFRPTYLDPLVPLVEATKERGLSTCNAKGVNLLFLIFFFNVAQAKYDFSLI